MKKLVFIIMIAVMAGCTGYEPGKQTKSGRSNVPTICIDGVEYLRLGHGLSPHLKKDGSLYLCE